MNPNGLIVLALMVGVFYLVAIRPQQKRLKQHQALVSSIQTGDEVITVGGIFGTVTQMDDTSITLRIADNTEVRFSRQAISRKLTEDAEPAEEDLDTASSDEDQSGPHSAV